MMTTTVLRPRAHINERARRKGEHKASHEVVSMLWGESGSSTGWRTVDEAKAVLARFNARRDRMAMERNTAQALAPSRPAGRL